MLTPDYSVISYGNIIFYLRPLFQEHKQGVKQGFGVNLQVFTLGTCLGYGTVQSSWWMVLL
jgi:hypothetical protein